MKYLIYLFIIFNFTISHGFNLHNPNPPKISKKYKNFKGVSGAAFAISFIPYFLDDEIKPICYKDGLTREEIKIKHKNTELSIYLKGDATYLYNIFPDFEVKIN
tara:strand:+ start:5641 stop:5952 length:312 start_codon:yes stop_codon:yes gene_type:complete